MHPISRRRKAWRRLENDLDRQKLASMTQEIDLSGVPAAAASILAGQVRGQIVVKIG
jgi:acrylyl-CoA reductase (NADPH)